MWAVIGAVLTVLVDRTWRQHSALAAKRELAASCDLGRGEPGAGIALGYVADLRSGIRGAATPSPASAAPRQPWRGGRTPTAAPVASCTSPSWSVAPRRSASRSSASRGRPVAHALLPRPRPGPSSAAPRSAVRPPPSSGLLAADDLPRCPAAADPSGRPRHLASSSRRGGPRRCRVGRREHLRRGRRPPRLGRGRRRPRPARLPRGQHARRDGRATGGERYDRFGWASARLDDLLNLPGARLSGLLAAGLAPPSAADRPPPLRAWARDARRHPSPNAGAVEAAFAGALGVRLGGRNTTAHGVEDRVLLGDGPSPTPDDIDRSVRLAKHVGTGAVVVAALVALRRGC